MAAWILVIVALALIGSDLDGKLSVRAVFVDGTSSQREHEISVREFGSDNAIVVLLKGPSASIEDQGRLLERRLGTIPGALVMSPWDAGGTIDGLRPSAEAAALVVNVPDPSGEDLTGALPPIRERVAETIEPPVRASLSGFPVIGEAGLDATQRAAKAGERIAVPLLLIVLLLVFRSVVAAALPLLIGGSVVVGTRGVLDLLLGLTPIDSFALGTVGMMGLALGVDYSLLIVSRFREETAKGADPSQAAQRTIATTGPTVLMAGTGLSLAMLIAAQLLPGTIVTSVAIAVIVSTALSVLSAMLVVPAILVLLGPKLELLALPRREGHKGLVLGWTRRLSRRPRLVAVPAILILLIGSLWAFKLNTEIATVALLPADDPGRLQQEEVQKALGSGWVAPYEIVMDGGDRPVTTPGRLRALADFQRRVEQDPGVATMAGFAGVERATRELAGFGDGLVAQRQGLDHLSHGLSRAKGGAALNTDGLMKAADGAKSLDSAIGAVGSGADQLAVGLNAVGSGSARLAGGLDKAGEGSGKLSDGTAKASTGASQLATGLAKARKQTGEIAGSARLLEDAMTGGEERLDKLDGSIGGAEERLAAVLSALQAMTTGRADPQFGPALAAAEEATAWLTGTNPSSGEASTLSSGAKSGVEDARGQFSLGLYLSKRLAKNGSQASEGMTKLARGSAKLDHALDKLAVGSRKVGGGISRLAEGGEALPSGLERLGAGAEALGSGLDQIHNGTTVLAGGLGGGAQKSKLLTGALGKINDGVAEQEEGDGKAAPPAMFRSGYFYLAGLDRSAPERRAGAGFLVSLDRGGHTARMLVIPSHAPGDREASETRARLEQEANGLARQTGTEVVVGGATPMQLDIDSGLRDQSPLARLALALITILILIPVMRSLTVPLIAAVLNALTVAATFGFLALLFNGSLLGGPGYVDTTVIPATIMVIFGLAIDYEVFIFARIREEYERTGSTEAAIDRGLERTAPVVTGAAMIMIVVFLAFATSSFSTIRGFGVAQAIAIAIDAFLVRLIIVPALMRALGPKAWWMPAWLERLLPRRAPVPVASEEA